jgi:hypothetical protein
VTSGASIDQRFSLHKQGNAKSGEKVEIFVTAFGIPLISFPYERVLDAADSGVANTFAQPFARRQGAVAQKSPVEKLRIHFPLSISSRSVSQ